MLHQRHRQLHIGAYVNITNLSSRFHSTAVFDTLVTSALAVDGCPPPQLRWYEGTALCEREEICGFVVSLFQHPKRSDCNVAVVSLSKCLGLIALKPQPNVFKWILGVDALVSFRPLFTPSIVIWRDTCGFQASEIEVGSSSNRIMPNLSRSSTWPVLAKVRDVRRHSLVPDSFAFLVAFESDPDIVVAAHPTELLEVNEDSAFAARLRRLGDKRPRSSTADLSFKQEAATSNQPDQKTPKTHGLFGRGMFEAACDRHGVAILADQLIRASRDDRGPHSLRRCLKEAARTVDFS